MYGNAEPCIGGLFEKYGKDDSFLAAKVWTTEKKIKKRHTRFSKQIGSGMIHTFIIAKFNIFLFYATLILIYQERILCILDLCTVTCSEKIAEIKLSLDLREPQPDKFMSI